MATMERPVSNGGAPPPTLIAPAPAVKRRTTTISQGPPKKRKLTPEKAKEIRLAQNRKAARESRKRKKAMIEELQRSVVFFSKSNNSLKHQNEELTLQLMDAKAKVAKLQQQQQQQAEENRNGGGAESAATVGVVRPLTSEPVAKAEGIVAVTATSTTTEEPQHDKSEGMKEQQSVQVKTETTSNNEGVTSEQGHNTSNSNALELLSSSAVVASIPPQPVSVALRRTLPLMQPGATMEEMAKFQQATAAAIHAAAKGMVGATSFHASAVPAAATTSSIMNPLNNGNNEQ